MIGQELIDKIDEVEKSLLDVMDRIQVNGGPNTELAAEYEDLLKERLQLSDKVLEEH